MNERIPRALVEDLKKTGGAGGSIAFHDDNTVYTVSIEVERVLAKSLRESRGTFISVGSAGAPCGCCNGTGRS